ncbi:hypothetical protein BS50DRAFT_657926 [Corynespora cassiicola Philippines]|uniref:NAD(P)-binding protein n=1 Tax=Corynespora cassiicola Philippines TaxID=1448308 RepID=A0A2T2P344_CORCC|nr:hypothetical protein BS50DRAFT_657926 [Corynespora cassiicola Philippines]
MSLQTVLITGCSDGGIGSILALTFQQCGLHVFATARDTTKMRKLKDLFNVTLLLFDITDGQAIYLTSMCRLPWLSPNYFPPLLIQAKGSLGSITTYSASKRMTKIISQSLRLEVEPFDVKVLSVVTDAVLSNGQTYFGDLALPEGSLYKHMEGTIAGWAQGNNGITRMPTIKHASAVVDVILERMSGKFWYGDVADLVKSIDTPPKGTGLDTWG